jgi:hypothetical protein
MGPEAARPRAEMNRSLFGRRRDPEDDSLTGIYR